MSIPAVFVIALIVNVGMWLERFVIVVTSLTRDFVPSSWGMYYPTIWDWSTFAGTIGVFLSLMFLFIRGLPAISIFEMREVVHHHGAEHARRLTPATEPLRIDGGIRRAGAAARSGAAAPIPRAIANGRLFADASRGSRRSDRIPQQRGAGLVFIAGLLGRPADLCCAGG